MLGNLSIALRNALLSKGIKIQDINCIHNYNGCVWFKTKQKTYLIQIEHSGIDLQDFLLNNLS